MDKAIPLWYKSNSNLIRDLTGEKSTSRFDYPITLNITDKTIKRFSVNIVQKGFI